MAIVLYSDRTPSSTAIVAASDFSVAPSSSFMRAFSRLIPEWITNLPSNLVWRVRSCFSSKGSRAIVPIREENTSSWRATYTVPQEFYQSQLGKKISTLLDALCRENVLLGTSDEMKLQLQRTIAVESCDTGEAMQRLLGLQAPTRELPRETALFFTLIDKIRSAVSLRMRDLSFSLHAKKKRTVESLDVSLPKIVRVMKEYVGTECRTAEAEERARDRVRFEVERLFQMKASIYHDIERDTQQIDAGRRVVEDLLQAEQVAFQAPETMSILLHGRVTTKEELRALFSEMAASSDVLFMRGMVHTAKSSCSSVLAGTLGKENVLYRPRLGDAVYRTKRECLEAFHGMLEAALQKSSSIELTVWKHTHSD